MLTVKELVNDSIKLHSLPEIYTQLNDVINDPNSSMTNVATVIRQDPGMTVRLLRIVNSPLFGMSSKIETVSQAVQMLGINQIHDLLIATSITNVFKGISKDVMNMEQYWQHSTYCGVVSRMLAHHCKLIESERLFLAGLLQDVGHLIMYAYLPNYMKRVTEKSRSEDISLIKAEEKIIGFNYAQVGGELMHRWYLPDSLYETTLYHTKPASAEKYPLEAAIVHIANVLKTEYINRDESDVTNSDEEKCDDEYIDENKPELPIDPVAWEITGLTSDIIELVQEEADEHTNNIYDLISPET
jgi:HD-like signal output (HDOD) protein